MAGVEAAVNGVREVVEIQVRAAGFEPGGSVYVFEVEPTMTGDVIGISMRRQGDRCGGVISFDDLERVYLAAKARRDEGARVCADEGHEADPDWMGGWCWRCGRVAPAKEG